VLEDSDEGLEAAAAAGMDAVDVRPLRAAYQGASPIG
jgi:beta-phosphoglucomutase-like phosphatase (HAD superfamily)